MKISKFSKVILILLLVLCAVVLAHRPILTKAGGFLAPTSNQSADVLILEGTQVVKNSTLNTGMRLLSEGRASRMIVVLHAPMKEGQVFAVPKGYSQFVIDELSRMGLNKDKIEIISAPIPGHPITLSEARFVVAKLSNEGFRSAILACEGFHARRSFGVYNQEGRRLGLSVIPYSYFTEYKNSSWWKDTQGIGDFLNESLKLSYYILHGYVSVSALRN
jgi:uncharacterized SAM-binding protein YcdF (DUF218 family)